MTDDPQCVAFVSPTLTAADASFLVPTQRQEHFTGKVVFLIFIPFVTSLHVLLVNANFPRYNVLYVFLSSPGWVRASALKIPQHLVLTSRRPSGVCQITFLHLPVTLFF